MKALNIGIIGAGGIAQDVHIPHYLSNGERVAIQAVCDVNVTKAQEVANRFSIPSVYENYTSMFAAEHLDAVSICIPNKFHADAAMTALKSGCHVLCEKPPAMSVDEAEMMRQTAEHEDKILTFGFHLRHAIETEVLKRYIDAGELGDIYAANVHWFRRRGIPGWGVFTNKSLQGGGPLIDIGVHMLDTALYLMDYPEPEAVFGTTYQRIGTKPGVGLMGEWDWRHFSIEDMARGMITFKNGASIMLDSAFAVNIREEESVRGQLMGDKGGADMFPLGIYQEKHDTLVDVSPVYLPERNEHETEISRFVTCCLEHTSPISTAAEGVKIQKIIQGLYQSAETGELVKL